MFQFFVDHAPVPQPRHRVTRWGSYIDPDHPVHSLKALAQMCYRQAGGKILEGPLECEIISTFGRPQNLITKRKPMHQEWYPRKCDADNLAKAILDALNGVAWQDDRQVTRLVCEKRMACDLANGWMKITIRKLTTHPEPITFGEMLCDHLN